MKRSGDVITWAAPVALALLALSGCASFSRPPTATAPPVRDSSTTVLLHGKPLELHVTAPRTPVADDVVVLYASGDGGWFGQAVDMFHQIGRAGYFAVGFSSRAFLKIERPRGGLVSAAQLADEYDEIVVHARRELGLDATTTRTVLTGWSRGAAFSVLVASEPAGAHPVLGVIAIGLAEGEDLQISGAEDDTDDGPASLATRRWPFDTYARIARLGPRPCAVIQATHDNYLPAARARQLFGPDTPTRRFYAVDAKNHRFAGGKLAFDAAFIDAIRWVVSQPERQGGDGVR
jgi:dienelactone hydrolase